MLALVATPLAASELPPLSHGLTAVTPARPAPALKLVDLDSKPHDLGALKGKVVLVNFWATWCPPCRREMPSLERLRQALPEVAILAVDVGEDADTIFAFTGQLEPAPGFPILLDRDSTAMQGWKVKGLPTTFVVDPQGRLVYRAVGGREFDNPSMIETIKALAPTK